MQLLLCFVDQLLGPMAYRPDGIDTLTLCAGTDCPSGFGRAYVDRAPLGVAAIDCDDDDPAVHPGAPDVPNGVDDDCDSTLDEG